jgi:purine-binding chemotaxis protein CheW
MAENIEGVPSGEESKSLSAAVEESLTMMDVGDDELGQYVTFFVDDESFAFPMESVLEIIRVPQSVRVPLTPSSLLGLANLRGTVLPVLDLRKLLALTVKEHTDQTRVIVVDCGKPVGLVVDRVNRVLTVEKARIESTASVQSTVRSDFLTGVVKDAVDGSLMQLLNEKKIVELEYGSLLDKGVSSAQRASRSSGLNDKDDAGEGGEDVTQLVSFMVDSEEYALKISEVEEIVRVPDDIRKVPHAEHHVLGLMNLRDRLLSLVSLRRMFNLSELDIDDNHRVVVANIGNNGGKESVGIVVDEVKEVLTGSSRDMEPLPSLLSKDGGLDEISAVCRLDNGARLVSVISSDALFEHPAMKAALAAGGMEQGEDLVRAEEQQNEMMDEEEIQMVVFNLAEEEYGVIIENVSEIIRVPEEMTKVPKTPEFIEGMVNLRGTVLPVLDMRVRFGLPKSEYSEKQRILVLDMKGVLTGFIVDSVTEVLRLSKSHIEDSPAMSADQLSIMGKVANLKEAERMILILEIGQLVDEKEFASISSAAA